MTDTELSCDVDLALSATQYRFVNSTARYPWLIGPEGEGKCVGRDTCILKFDGSCVPVQEIIVGDLLMGPDSRPRRVQALGRGREQMVRIIPTKGDPWVCTQDHLLALQRGPNGSKTGTGRPKGYTKSNEIVVLTVQNYLSRSRTFQTQHYQYRVPIDFPEQQIPIDPYWLGVWLGDGDAHRPCITTPDAEIVEYLHWFAAHERLRLVRYDGAHRCSRYTIVGGDTTVRHHLTERMTALSLLRNKHVPPIYKANSRRIRQTLLAGLLDTDGWVNRSGYQFLSKHRRLADDVAFLARSLGLAANVKAREKYCQTGAGGTYWHVMIHGDCRELPLRVKRKQPIERRQCKNVLRTHIKAIEPLGMGDYYGFTLDGDGLFLLGDFTVTHNTFAAIASYFAHHERTKDSLPINPLTNQAYPMLGALVRDTHANLKRITVRSIERGFPGVFHFQDDCHRMVTDGLEIDLLGMDAEDALGRIQGGEYDIIHIEEPAPIIHTGNQGMREEVYEVCMRRIRGGTNRPKRLGVSMNPGPKLHWTYKWAIQNPVPSTEIFHIKKGENPHISQEDREARVHAFRFRPDLAKRYDEGEFADTYPGVAITPEYKPEYHLAKEWLLPIPHLECIRLYDGGLNPTVVIIQFTPSGRLHFLDAVQLRGGGMQQLIQSRLKVVLARPRYQRITKWRDLGDDTLKSPEQSNSEHSAAKIIEDLLKTTYEGGVQDWDTRRNALKFIFTQSPDGLPMVQVNPRPTEGEEVNLVECAFSGGYSYPVNAMGVVSREGPDKASRFSHVGDAIGHGLAKLFFRPQEQHSKRDQKKAQQRSRSYAVGVSLTPSH